MTNLSSFLYQTCSVSFYALIILFIKKLFKDKLPPKWQASIWLILLIPLCIPVSLLNIFSQSYLLAFIETIKSLLDIKEITHVSFVIPFITSIPHSLLDIIFVVYVFGVIITLARYLKQYYFLKNIVSKGKKNDDCVILEGITSPFVIGIIKPILVLPEGEVDEKIVMHEYIHMKNQDTLWSMIICLFRSLHWCNPLLQYCSNIALNDLESRCDQEVLEALHGEQRREYGYLLLSMVSEKYSSTPGCTCINNGGKNIKARIEAIARFKTYPQGMKLVSYCILILLCASFIPNVQAYSMKKFPSDIFTQAFNNQIKMNTLSGAIDFYAKKHHALFGYDFQDSEQFLFNSYNIHNLKKKNSSSYSAMLVFNLDDYMENEEVDVIYQNIEIKKKSSVMKLKD